MPVNELLAILREEREGEAAWRQILRLLQRSSPSGLWESLPPVQIERDVGAAADWLHASLGQLRAPLGVYLGLDTLNMTADGGHNVEIGWTTPLNVDKTDTDRLDEGLVHGARHRIDGLAKLQSTHARPEWAALFSTADYMLFLGYAGIVLRDAIGAAALPAPLLTAWGFHDGDIFVLGRLTADGFVTLAK